MFLRVRRAKYQRFFRVSESQPTPRQILPGRNKAGIKVQGSLKPFVGRVVIALIAEKYAQIIECRRIPRVRLRDFHEDPLRPFSVAQPGERLGPFALGYG
jgi:hypothetical protein